MNPAVLILFGIAAIALIVFLVWRNQKDKKDFEEQAGNDYDKTKDKDHNTTMDESDPVVK